MAVGIFFIVFFVAEILIYSFHLSVFILLFVKRNSAFTGHFHVIFKIVIIGDVINFVLTTFFQKTALIPELMPFYKDSEYFGTIMYDLFSYVLFGILFGHVLMAFNRFTLIWFPLNYQRIWEKQWYFFVLFILPFVYFGWRIVEPAKFVYLTEEKVNIVYSNPNVMGMYTLTASLMNLISTFLAAIFNLLSFIKFYFYKSTTINVKEKTLLLVSFITFITQLLRASYTIQQFLFPSSVELTMFFLTLLPIFNDIFALSGTVSFLILSASTRKQYKAFYLCQKNNLSTITVLTTATSMPRSTARRNTQMKVTFYDQPSLSHSTPNLKE